MQETPNPVSHDIFNTPLTPRGYLLERELDAVYGLEKFQSWDRRLGYVAALIYLYGGEVVGMHEGSLTPDTGSGMMRDKNEPSLYFRYRDKPLTKYVGESALISEELKKRDHTMWYPYTSWPDEEGESVRADINTLLAALPLTAEYTRWKQDNDAFTELVDRWHTEFVAGYSNANGLECKLWDKEKYLELSVADPRTEVVTDAARFEARQEEYLGLFEAFAAYAYRGFLEGAEAFPPCKYE